MGGDEELVHAAPQTRGKVAHETIDNKRYSDRKSEISGLSVFCNEFGIAGRIDIYKYDEKLLIERKYQLNAIYQGQIYQLWGEYFCMIEMGYEVEKLAFYAITANKTFPVALPNDADKKEFGDFILKFKQFNPEQSIDINTNKCTHCIYCALCDKVDIENVYA
jgi:CRISPR-associated protein Cas4